MTTKRRAKIGIFDSGVGGLSILASLRERIGANWFYCSDNKNYPYGTKGEAEVTRAALAAARTFCEVAQLDALVVACNTASTVALEKLRHHLDIPVVGVVPAIKPAAEQSKSGVIGLLATPATVARPYTHQLITEFAPHCKVLRHGSGPLVEIAEMKLKGLTIDDRTIEEEIHSLFSQCTEPESGKKLDTIVLGCTHFPLILEELVTFAPWQVRWVDSGEAIANRVASLLKDAFDLSKSDELSVGQAFFTLGESDERLHQSFFDRGLRIVEVGSAR